MSEWEATVKFFDVHQRYDSCGNNGRHYDIVESVDITVTESPLPGFLAMTGPGGVLLVPVDRVVSVFIKRVERSPCHRD